MANDLIQVAVASFVSGVTGALVGSMVMVVAMRVDVRWLKQQNTVLHNRIDKTKGEFGAALVALRKRIDDTRDLVLGRRP